MQGERYDDDDRGNADEHGDVGALGVLVGVVVNAAWCWLVVVMCVLGGCTLLRWGDNPGHLDNITPTITVLKIDVPTVDITFGWSNGTFLLRNGGLIAGLVGAALMLILVISLMPLVARWRADRK